MRPAETVPSGVGGGRTQSGVVFILGAARSGTTLLYKALCLHPNAAYVSNWVARFPRVPSLASGNRLAHRAEALRRSAWFAGGGQAYVYGRRRSPLERAFPSPVEGEPVYASAGVPRWPAPDFASEDAAAALRRSFERIRRASGGSILVSKRISNNARIPFLARTFPSARFVVIVRDGRAVAQSLSRVDWWPGAELAWTDITPREWERRGGDPWELCARSWVDDVARIEAGLRVVPEDRVRTISYEDFVTDPLGTIGDVGVFAGLPATGRWGAALAALSFPNAEQAWRTTLPPDAIETITSIQRETLLEHGYVP